MVTYFKFPNSDLVSGSIVKVLSSNGKSSIPQMSSVFLVVEPSKIIFLIENTIPQKENRILLYSEYHSIPK